MFALALLATPSIAATLCSFSNIYGFKDKLA